MRSDVDKIIEKTLGFMSSSDFLGPSMEEVVMNYDVAGGAIDGCPVPRLHEAVIFHTRLEDVIVELEVMQKFIGDPNADAFNPVLTQLYDQLDKLRNNIEDEYFQTEEGMAELYLEDQLLKDD